MTCCGLRESVAESSVGIARASSKELTDMDWAPPSAAARAWTVERTRFTNGCWAVRASAEVWTWKRSRTDWGSVAPRRRVTWGHIRRIARDLATSSRKSLLAE